jgi:hypothetical protein
MDALTEVYNEETHIQDAGLLWVSSVLATHSLVARPAAPMPSVSPPVVLSAARGASTSLHYDHCGRDGHVKAFYYRKKKAQKAQAHRSSQGTSGSSSERSKRSLAELGTQELLMLLHRLVAYTSSGVVGCVTQPSTLIGSATASQSSPSGPSSAPSPSTYPWYLDYGASFYMTLHYAHLSSLHPSYHHCIVHTVDGSHLSVARQGTLSSDSFYVSDVSLIPDLTMQLMSAGQIADHDCRVIPDPNFCYI